MTKKYPTAHSQPREPFRTVDDYGRPIVLVPLHRGKTAVIDGGDFEGLMQVGLSNAWHLNEAKGCQYVRAALAGTRGKGVTIARILTGAGRRRIVRYRDGNRLNLRRSNLWLTHGHGKRNDMELVLVTALAKNQADQFAPPETPAKT